jgi:hypothetical protein
MSRLSTRWPCWLLLSFLFLGLVNADTSTTVVSVTSTKTVHVTATDYTGACENFVGACVVYGTYGNAPYTTTVYVGQQSTTPPPPPTITTSTTTIVATTTASNSGACSGFVGACVVYATNSRNAPASTVYYAGSSASARPGNAQGYIGESSGDSDGYIGGASYAKASFTVLVLGLACALSLVLHI